MIAIRALELRECLADAMQVSMFTGNHPFVFGTLQRALICLPRPEYG